MALEDDFELSMAELQANRVNREHSLELFRESATFFARAWKLSFDALLQAGFDRADALEILCTRGWRLDL